MNQRSLALTSGCGCCRVRSLPETSRRGFLGGCTACLAATALTATRCARADEVERKAKIRLVFSYIPSDRPIWPNIGYDFEKRKGEIQTFLTKHCPQTLFEPVDARTRDEARAIVDSSEGYDGFVVYTLGLWSGVPQIISASQKPTIFVDDLYGGSGEWLIHYAAAMRAGHKVHGVSSSRWDDAAAAIRCFDVIVRGGSADDFLAACTKLRKQSLRPIAEMTCKPDAAPAGDIGQCLERMSKMRILCVGRDPGGMGKAIAETFKTEVCPITFKELHDEFLKADRELAGRRAEQWMQRAEKVVEPSRETIIDSAAMYDAMHRLLERHKAQAITINCLGGFYGKHITAYPCLGFTELNDGGLVGACEADLRSTVSMLAMTTLTGRPGYISDPVLDTAKYQIIYAHCVAPTKVFGVNGPTNPYHIRNHSEDRQGAALRSLLPLGYMTTTLLFDPVRKQMIIHQGRSAENIDHDMACRTKLAVEVKGDIEKLMQYWDQWGWHRVTFYGDLKEQACELSKALGFRIIEEA